MWVPTLASIFKAASGQHSDCFVHFDFSSYSVLLSLVHSPQKVIYLLCSFPSLILSIFWFFFEKEVYLLIILCIYDFHGIHVKMRGQHSGISSLLPSESRGLNSDCQYMLLPTGPSYWPLIKCVFQDYINQFLFCLSSQRYIIILVYWHHRATLVTSFGYKSSIEFPTQANEATWSPPFLHSS